MTESYLNPLKPSEAEEVWREIRKLRMQVKDLEKQAGDLRTLHGVHKHDSHQGLTGGPE